MKNVTILNKEGKDTHELASRAEIIFNHVANSLNCSNNPDIRISFHTSRKSYDNSVGRKTQIWEVGNTSSSNNKIDIIHPNFFAKVSNHTDSEFDRILAHEIAHIFINKIASGKAIPFWLNEGLAMNVAGQLDKYRSGLSMFIEERFTSHLATKQDWDQRANFDAYKIACLFTAFLIEKFTLNKILELITKVERNYYAPHFEKSFLDILGRSIHDMEDEFLLWSNKIF